LSAVADLEKYAVFVTYHNSILLLAKTYWALARKSEAQEIIRLHEQKVGESGNPAFILQVDALKAQFALDIDDMDGASRWAHQADPMMFVEPMFLDEIVSPYWARILTESDDTIVLKAVQVFLVQRLALVESRHNVGRQIKILAQLSLANTKLGQTDIALKQLKRCLQLAQPQGYVRTFVDLGSQMSTLLGDIAAAEILDESLGNYVSFLLNAFPRKKETTSPNEFTLRRAQAVMQDPLTQRESEVLVLLAKRLKYREIAQSLFISMPTTKKHISHIYAKLDVNNRGDAIEKAKSLGILP
jgi:LuxR family maltose regulon positive regulatory protein